MECNVDIKGSAQKFNIAQQYAIYHFSIVERSPFLSKLGSRKNDDIILPHIEVLKKLPRCIL